MATPQSKLLVNSIEAFDPAGPVTVSYGASVPATGTLTVNGNAAFSSGIITTHTHAGTDVNVTGVLTASAYVGSASNFTSLPIIDDGKAIAFTLLG